MKKNNPETNNVSRETLFKLLTDAAGELNIRLSKDVLLSLFLFWELLLKWNATHNLTSVTDTKRAVIRHFADSLLPLSEKNFFEEGVSVLDFGTGGGFPGVPLSVCLPKCSFFLLDKARKKISFLKYASAHLSLSNVFPVCGNLVDIGRKYDVVVSRAVNIEPALQNKIKTILAPSGVFIQYLSSSQELAYDKKLIFSKTYFLAGLKRKLAFYQF